MTCDSLDNKQSKNGQVGKRQVEQSVHIEQSEIQQSLWTGNVGRRSGLVSGHLSESLVELLGDRLELLLLAQKLILKPVHLQDKGLSAAIY